MNGRTKKGKHSRIVIRTTPAQKRLLDQYARGKEEALSTWLRRIALEIARREAGEGVGA